MLAVSRDLTMTKYNKKIYFSLIISLFASENPVKIGLTVSETKRNKQNDRQKSYKLVYDIPCICIYLKTVVIKLHTDTLILIICLERAVTYYKALFVLL